MHTRPPRTARSTALGAGLGAELVWVQKGFRPADVRTTSGKVSRRVGLLQTHHPSEHLALMARQSTRTGAESQMNFLRWLLFAGASSLRHQLRPSHACNPRT